MPFFLPIGHCQSPCGRDSARTDLQEIDLSARERDPIPQGFTLGNGAVLRVWWSPGKWVASWWCFHNDGKLPAAGSARGAQQALPWWTRAVCLCLENRRPAAWRRRLGGAGGWTGDWGGRTATGWRGGSVPQTLLRLSAFFSLTAWARPLVWGGKACSVGLTKPRPQQDARTSSCRLRYGAAP
jgi:hypothetical protein